MGIQFSGVITAAHRPTCTIRHKDKLMELGFTEEEIVSYSDKRITALFFHAEKLMKLGFAKEEIVSYSDSTIYILFVHAEKLMKLGFAKEEILPYSQFKIITLGVHAEELMELGFTKKEIASCIASYTDSKTDRLCLHITELIKLGLTVNHLKHWKNSKEDGERLDLLISSNVKEWLDAGYHSLNFVLSMNETERENGPQVDSTKKYIDWAKQMLSVSSINTRVKLEAYMILRDIASNSKFYGWGSLRDSEKEIESILLKSKDQFVKTWCEKLRISMDISAFTSLIGELYLKITTPYWWDKTDRTIESLKELSLKFLISSSAEENGHSVPSIDEMAMQIIGDYVENK